MPVSVIIPVFNAEAYIEQAVRSALDQPETGEVILIEDGSSDGSLAVCGRLQHEHRPVQLLRHPGGENRGAGASRNLGIRHSGHEMIAFLDADDYYLPGRFTLPLQLLEQIPEADGIYEATQDFYDTAEIRDRHQKAGTLKLRLNTVRAAIPPQDLFKCMHLESIGHFWICSMTLRTSIFERVGLFDEHLRTAQDKVLIRKMAAICKLYPGRLDQPVAMRRVHRHNRVTGVDRSADEWARVRRDDWETMLAWGAQRLDPPQKQALLIYYMGARNRVFRKEHPAARLIPWCWLSMWMLTVISREYPAIRIEAYYRRLVVRTCLLAIYPPKLIEGFWHGLKNYLSAQAGAIRPEEQSGR